MQRVEKSENFMLQAIDVCDIQWKQTIMPKQEDNEASVEGIWNDGGTPSMACYTVYMHYSGK